MRRECAMWWPCSLHGAQPVCSASAVLLTCLPGICACLAHRAYDLLLHHRGSGWLLVCGVRIAATQYREMECTDCIAVIAGEVSDVYRPMMHLYMPASGRLTLQASVMLH